MTKRKNYGMSLLELMVTVVIIGILGAISYPSYVNYVRRTNRTDATATLLRVASAQEKFFGLKNTYSDTMGSGGLNISGTERGYYTLSFSGTPDAVQFTAVATAPSGSRQFADTDCRTFTITSTGIRGAKKADGTTDNTAACWR